MSSSPNQLSFLPDDYLERKAQRRTNVVCAGLFLVVLIGIGSAFSFSERLNRDVDKTYDAKMKEFTSEAKRIRQAEKMQDKQRTMARQAELAASLLEKVPRSFILAEITNAMPPGVSLVEFNLESKLRNAKPVAPVGASAFEKKTIADAKKKAEAAQAADPVKHYDVTMKLTGIAPTDVQVAEFIRKLNLSKMLKDVNLIITDQLNDKDAGESLRKFQVELTLDPNAEVQAQDNNKTVAVEIQPQAQAKSEVQETK